MKYVCQVCGYVYDEEAEGVPFAELPDSWTCPMCKAPKSMFAPEESEERNVTAIQPASIDADMLQLSPGALAALFSNLARGAEKQYMEKEPVLFRRISEYFAAVVPSISDADINMLRAISAEDIDNAYPQTKAIASSKGDRGALRACTWGEKVERILQALLDRYRSEVNPFLRIRKYGYAAYAVLYISETTLLRYVLYARFLTGNLNASKGEMYEKVCCKKYCVHKGDFDHAQ